MNRSRSSRVRVFIGCVCLLALTYIVPHVQALTLGCETVWKQASAGNNLWDCLKDKQRIGSHWRYYVYPGFAALFFVLLLALFPIVFCICITNGCCCRTCCFPTSPAQHYNGPCCLYAAAFIAILWGAGATVAIIMGANTIHTGTKDALYNAKYKCAQYYNDTANEVLAYATNGLENSPDVPPSFVSSTAIIFDIAANLTDTIDDVDNKYLKYVDDAVIVSYAIGWLPFALLFFTLIFSCAHVTRGFPALCSCIYFFVGLVFSLIAVIFLVAAYFMSAANGEVDRQVDRMPGVLQWYAVPYFDRNVQPDLANLDTQLESLFTARLAVACDRINTFCSSQPEYATATPFFCAERVMCTSLEQLLQLTMTVPVKDPTMCTPGPSDAPSDTACTIGYCAQHCLSEAAAAARDASVSVMSAVYSTKNSTIAEDLVVSLRESNMIADTLLWATDSFPDIREGFWMAGSGYFIAVLVFAIGIYIMLRGRVVWGEYVERDKRV
ncbi:hypothetical protein DQ04_01721000 [Trypanosoma grayi]|uniref:hypothetical protein n=1 Tax=Trypanosoma grayi TaxID=71804 RepID=UPI0004F4A81F|nr:hypothetical protein DQ04_01721000 [Trypanosoma grayi]KEG12425.1 hypothetical protein DQ04_01721000 [Trypanosoma grayi]